MSDYDDEQPEETAGVQIDAYGLKARIVPADSEPPPLSWREVWNRVNRALMRVVVGICEVAAEAIDGTKRLLRGLTRMPEAINKRVEGAHARADTAEGHRQDQVSVRMLPRDAEDALEAALLRAKASGVHVQLERRHDGQVLLVLVRPELAEKALALAKQHDPLPSPTNTEDIQEAAGKLAGELGVEPVNKAPPGA